MKINFKTILIIFLVGLLGGAAGTYGTLGLCESQRASEKAPEEKTEHTIEQISYTNDISGSYVNAIDKALDSVVEITTKAEVTSYSFWGGSSVSDATYLGSGVVISSDGYIVTNNHVVDGAKNVSIKMQNGDTYEATIIGQDAKTDLALLKIDADGLYYSQLVDSDELKLGEEIVAIGNAMGNGTSCSNGIISAIDREVTIKNYTMTLILTNAEINSGNSGGGLFDLNGNLVGIVNAKMSSSLYSNSASIEGIAYAIPANTVKAIVEELLNNGYVKDRPALGIVAYTSEYNAQYGVTGVMVKEVLEGGSAARAGIMAGDTIKTIDGREISEFSQLSRILDDYEIGDQVTLEVEREGSLLTFTCTLQETIKY